MKNIFSKLKLIISLFWEFLFVILFGLLITIVAVSCSNKSETEQHLNYNYEITYINLKGDTIISYSRFQESSSGHFVWVNDSTKIPTKNVLLIREL